MKKIFILSLLIITNFVIQAQQFITMGQVMQNSFLVNPAVAGSDATMPVCISGRQQWAGFGENAPRIFTASIHGFKDQYGFGGYIISDIYGHTGNTGAALAYSYHIKFENIKAKLALGVAIKAMQFSIDESTMNYYDKNDPVLIKGIETALIPNADFGAYLYHEKFYAGFSANHLLGSSVKIGTEGENKQAHSFHFLGGVKLKANETIDLEPGGLIQINQNTKAIINLGVKTSWKKSAWLGVYYRTNQDLFFIAGYKYNHYSLGYSYALSMSKIKNYSNGSHEIIIGIDLKTKENNNKALL